MEEWGQGRTGDWEGGQGKEDRRRRIRDGGLRTGEDFGDYGLDWGLGRRIGGGGLGEGDAYHEKRPNV